MKISYRIKRHKNQWALFDSYGPIWYGSSVQELIFRLTNETSKFHIEIGEPNGYPL